MHQQNISFKLLHQSKQINYSISFNHAAKQPLMFIFSVTESLTHSC